MSDNIHRADFFNDHRAHRLFDIFPSLEGQVTVSNVSANQFSGWHRHEKQYDLFAVIEGSLNIGVITETGAISVVKLSRGESIRINTGDWHCYHSGSTPATLIYYLSRKHDEQDEFRATEEEMLEKYNFKMYPPADE